MFDFGWSEILVIAIVLIVIVGPKDLPRVLRSFGRTTAKMRAMAGDFRKQFDEALREAELDDVKGLVDDVRRLDPRNEIRKHLSPLEEAGRDIRSGLDKAGRPNPAASASSTPAVADSEPKVATTPEAVEPRKTGATQLPDTKTVPSKAPAAKTTTKRTAAKAAAKPAGSGSKPVAKPAKTASTAEPPVEKKTAPRPKKTAGSST